MTARLAIAAVGLLLLGASGTGSARDVAERWAVALASGSGAEVAALYHRDGSHRDLASGRLARGEAALADFFDASPRPNAPPVVSAPMPLGADAFVARLVSTGAEAGGADWPPYTAVLVTRVGGRWAVSATRAGGNPDEGAAGPGTP